MSFSELQKLKYDDNNSDNSVPIVNLIQPDQDINVSEQAEPNASASMSVRNKSLEENKI